VVIVKKYDYITDKKHLLTKQRKWMRVLGSTLNQRVPRSVKKVGKRKSDRLYYKMNRDQIIEKSKIHRKKNIEYYRYRETHYIQLKTKATKMIECGCMIRNDCLIRHRKSKRHTKLLNAE
jgi:hypothetical protein